MADVLPAEVVHRPKQGFRVPLSAWLAGPLRSGPRSVSSRRSPRARLLDFGYIEHLWHRHRSRKADQSFDLWCLINLFSWYEHWFA